MTDKSTIISIIVDNLGPIAAGILVGYLVYTKKTNLWWQNALIGACVGLVASLLRIMLQHWLL